VVYILQTHTRFTLSLSRVNLNINEFILFHNPEKMRENIPRGKTVSKLQGLLFFIIGNPELHKFYGTNRRERERE
jgi:hypothetical protein